MFSFFGPKEQLKEYPDAEILWSKGREAYDKGNLPGTDNAEKLIQYNKALEVWEDFVSRFPDHIRIHQVHAIKRKTLEKRNYAKEIEDAKVKAAEVKARNEKIHEMLAKQAEEDKAKNQRRLDCIAAGRERLEAAKAIRHAEAHAEKKVSMAKIRSMTEEIKKADDVRAKEYAEELVRRKKELMEEQEQTAAQEAEERRKIREESKKMEEEFEKVMKAKALELDALRYETKIKREKQQKEKDAATAERKKRNQEILRQQKIDSEARIKVAADKVAAEADVRRAQHAEDLKVKKAAELAKFEKAKKEAAEKAEKERIQRAAELEELARQREKNERKRAEEIALQVKRKQQLIADNEAARKAKVAELTAAHLRLHAATEKALHNQAETLASQSFMHNKFQLSGREFKFRTLNYGAPGDIAVNVFEYITRANAPTSIAFQELLKTTLKGDKAAIAEAYGGADILDRRFKVGSRQSPLFQTQGMEFLWSPSFSIESYIETASRRILDAFQADPELRKSQIKNAKIDIVVAKEKAAAKAGFDEGRRTQQLLEEAVHKLVFFDAHCAKAIRDTVSWEQFCGLHAAASAVISRTNESILEELQQSQDSVYFLQELNPTVIESIRALIRPHGFSIKSTADGSSAIIYPTAFDSEIRVIEFPADDTFLHVETLVLGYRKLLLISSHFSAKTKAKAQEEGKTVHKNMDDQLVALNSFIAAKTAEGLICVIGGDFNQNTQTHSAAADAASEAAPAVAAEFVCPAAGTPTTCKERSALQVQFKKINKPDSGSKDRICIASPSPPASASSGGAGGHAEAVEVLDCRVRSLYTHGKAACSYALKPETAAGDTSLHYPVRLQYPIYGTHFPDHDVVEVVAVLRTTFIV